MLAERGAQYVAAALSLAAAALAAIVLWGESGAPGLPSLEEAVSSGPGEQSLPIGFEPNAGRTAGRVDFLARGPGNTLFIGAGEATFSFAGDDAGRGAALRMRAVGASTESQPTAAGRMPGTVNDFSGPDRSEWRTGIRSYRTIRYAEAYPGIDMVWHGRTGELEYDFIVGPGADPSRIAMRFAGQDALRIGPDRGLRISVGSRELRQRPPVAYQRIDGRRVPVSSAFAVEGDTVRFRLGSYDRSRPLVIDPLVLAYSNFVGGSLQDTGRDMTIRNATGEAYMLGETSSTDFPTTPGVLAPNNLPGQDVTVTRISAGGGTRVFATYLGGNADDDGFGIDVREDNGRIAITGQTTSTNFPTTAGSFRPADPDNAAGEVDAFVTVLSPAGTSLVYSTYLGGAATAVQAAVGRGVKWDIPGGGITVAGQTTQANFPTNGAETAFDATYNAGGDVFLTRLHPAGGGAADLDYSTFIGGNGFDFPLDVEIDGAGRAVLTGVATSNFPISCCSFDTTLAGATDSFITRIDTHAGAGGLSYSGWHGGTGTDDFAADISLDSQGRAYVTGRTDSANMPTTPGAFDTSLQGAYDGFLVVINGAGTARAYSTFVGGADGVDFGTGLDVDAAGDAYVTGLTDSTNFPVRDAYDPTDNPTTEAFVARIRPAGTGNTDLIMGTYLGGLADDIARDVAVDSSGNLFVGGFTNSADFPAAGFDTTYGGNGFDDGFVTKLSPPAPQPAQAAAEPVASFGAAIKVSPVSGTVLAKVPGGAFVPIQTLTVVPPGTVIDATEGFARITAKQCDGVEETAVFWDGTFRIDQGGDVGCLLEAKLVEKLRCKKGGGKKAANTSAPVARAAAGSRRLWGQGSGRFRTRGRRGSATVRGTTWLTKDRCTSTLFKVTEGVGIEVRDPGAKPARTKLGAGDKYTAR